MSFRICVYLPSEQTPPPEDPELFEQWLDQAEPALHDEPLASDGDYFNYWHLPATKLDLPFLSSVYQEGLTIKDKRELSALSRECNEIERYWLMLGLDDRKRLKLQERLGNLREAIDLTSNLNAWLYIS